MLLSGEKCKDFKGKYKSANKCYFQSRTLPIPDQAPGSVLIGRKGLNFNIEENNNGNIIDTPYPLK